MKINIERYTCTNCAIGEESSCVFFALNPDNQIPVSCPYGTHGEDAKWKKEENED